MLLFFILGLAGVLSTYYGLLAGLGLFALLIPYGIVDAVILIRRMELFHSQWYSHWYVYLIWPLTYVLLIVGIQHTPDQVLGYRTFRIADTGIQGVVESREIILVDTRAHKQRPLKVGDVVVLNSHAGNVLVRRVHAVPTTSTVEVLDKRDTEDQSKSTYAMVPVADIIGIATAVLFSHYKGRIGKRIE